VAHPQPANVHWSKERAAQEKLHQILPGDARAPSVALPPAPWPTWECHCSVSSIWAQQPQVSLEALGIQEPICIGRATFPSTLPQLPHLEHGGDDSDVLHNLLDLGTGTPFGHMPSTRELCRQPATLGRVVLGTGLPLRWVCPWDGSALGTGLSLGRVRPWDGSALGTGLPLRWPTLSCSAAQCCSFKEEKLKAWHPGGAPLRTSSLWGAGKTPCPPGTYRGWTSYPQLACQPLWHHAGRLHVAKKSWHPRIFARSRHRKPSISLNPCFQGPILLPTDYESRLHILNKPLFTTAFSSLQCIMCMCILAWQALTYCFDCYRPAMKGPIVLGSPDDIRAPTRAARRGV